MKSTGRKDERELATFCDSREYLSDQNPSICFSGRLSVSCDVRVPAAHRVVCDLRERQRGCAAGSRKVSQAQPGIIITAILMADVAGYSRLIGIDDEGTLAQLNAHHAELIEPKIKEHRGRIVRTTGDGLLVLFVSAVEALRCAVEIQRAMAQRNAQISADKRIEFRMGVNVGDVVEGTSIHGDGINVAARLEAMAEPGGICVSSRVQEDARGSLARLGIAFEDIGQHELKNIQHTVHIYRVLLDQGDAKTRPSLPIPDKPSIAVLPFQNMSGDPEQEYFADGMVEDIITGLSRFRWLFVIARNSSFTYKGRAVDVKQVGRELGVRYLLEGSVRKSANRIRIAGQLIDASSGDPSLGGSLRRSA